jgi:hypothetical protein
MVETAANSKGKLLGFWFRASFVAISILGNLATTAIYAYYYALSFWYLLPGSGHFDRELAKHYANLENSVYLF